MKRNSLDNKKSVYHLPSITLVQKVKPKYSHKVFRSEDLPPAICISFDQQYQRQEKIPKLIEQYYRNLKSSRTLQRDDIYPSSENSAQSYLKIKRKKKYQNAINIKNKKEKKEGTKQYLLQFVRYQDIQDYQNNSFGYQSQIKEGGNPSTKDNLVSRLKGLERLNNQDDTISRRCISKFFTYRRADNSTESKSPTQKSEDSNFDRNGSFNKQKCSPKKAKIRLLPVKKIKYKLKQQKDEQTKDLKIFIAHQNVDLSGWSNQYEEGT